MELKFSLVPCSTLCEILCLDLAKQLNSSFDHEIGKWSIHVFKPENHIAGNPKQLFIYLISKKKLYKLHRFAHIFSI